MARPNTERTVEEWASTYRNAFAEYDACAQKLESLLHDLLAEGGLDVVQVESRAKDAESFVRKLQRKKGQYERPLVDMTDLIGVRVITYYLEDVARVADVIAQEFTVDEDASVDKAETLDPDRFGYVSVHYIVSLGSARAGLAEWTVFAGKKAEIQVRTATQHAWAAIDHKLSYKSSDEAPPRLRRRLSQLSALFELADEQFSLVRREAEEAKVAYSKELRAGNLDLPVDSTALDVYLATSQRVQTAGNLAAEYGYDILEPDESETAQERLARDRRDLLRVLDRFGVATLAELDALLADESLVREKLARLVPVLKEVDNSDGFMEDFLTQLVLFVRDADEEAVRDVYVSEIWQAFEKAYALPH
jgi:ppGpp synthetase/RelA/SpoT-type nucleotidyltranferase